MPIVQMINQRCPEGKSHAKVTHSSEVGEAICKVSRLAPGSLLLQMRNLRQEEVKQTGKGQSQD